MRFQTLQIRFTPIQEIGSWFAERVLHAACKQQRRSQGEGQAHPRRVPFPKPAFPKRRAYGTSVLKGRFRLGTRDEREDQGDDGGRDERDEDEG